ncbi:serine hydrolase [Chitinophaga sp. MD30]|uniref:serine hydrolase domain-containing protein n=1 Tax=Chitinophaga sp. MD30 TaxID=2033437 RepID=UPI000BAF9B5B|nr:serine hydrolase domain-containing protein [Chitinophaga sp. MD30]ASZ14069.1 hypothetical protein CK934_25520 [Chitinophaga sp. MD30]
MEQNKITWRWLYLPLVMLLALACKKDKQEESKPPVEQPGADKLTDNIEAIRARSYFPGLYTAVIKDGKLIYARSFGVADATTSRTFNPSTIMPVASITKTLASIAVMKGIELGYFNMETNINDILPFAVVNPYHPDIPIKLKHLVTHTSSVYDTLSGGNDNLVLEKTPKQSLGDFLKDYFVPGRQLYKNSNFLGTKPGEKFEYSNYATALAAYLVELKSGISYASFVKKYVFDPLQLQSAHWFYDNTRSDLYAGLYHPIYLWLPVYSQSSYPDGSWRISGEDMVKYLQEMMKAYEGNSSLLKRESWQQIFTPKVTAVPGMDMCIFWFKKQDVYMHGGTDPGICTKIGFDAKRHYGWIIMTNTSVSATETVTLHADFNKIESSLIDFADRQ